VSVFLDLLAGVADDRDSGLIKLTTTLVHASGEWASMAFLPDRPPHLGGLPRFQHPNDITDFPKPLGYLGGLLPR